MSEEYKEIIMKCPRPPKESQHSIPPKESQISIPPKESQHSILPKESSIKQITAPGS